jgi:hypothetical protein
MDCLDYMVDGLVLFIVLAVLAAKRFPAETAHAA